MVRYSQKYSQNGWPVVGSDNIDKSPINGHYYPNGFLKGDVYEAFRWLFTQMSNRVESVVMGNPPDEWGYYVKNIEGSQTVSNHASGTAGDYNATEHPMGKHNTYTIKQQAEINKILVEARGIFRWGGNYTGRPDDMHFEIIKNPTSVHNFVVSIKPQGAYRVNILLDGYGLPTLVLGDDDSKRAGTNYITIAQLLLNVALNAGLKVDGIYGEATETAVNRLPDTKDGKSLGLAAWSYIYGMKKVVA